MKRMLVSSLIFASVLFFGGCGQVKQQERSNQGGVVQEEVKEDDREVKTAEDDGEVGVTYEDEIITVLEDNKYSWNEVVKCENIEYQILEVVRNNEIGTKERNRMDYAESELDAEGKLTGTEEFLWIRLKIKNTGNQTEEVVLNDNTFVGITENNEVFGVSNDAVYIEPEQKGMESRERFHYEIKAGEEKEIELGYLVEPTEKVGNLYYSINRHGEELDHPDNKFLNVEEFWNE